MKTHLVTGGAGFYGTILKRSLVADGAKVVSVDLQKDDYRHKNFIPIRGDIRDTKLLDKICQQYHFDAIFHCAAMLAHDTKNHKDLWTSNVDGTKNIADFAVKNRCSKVLFVSSNCLWGQSFSYEVSENEPPHPVEIYGKSKLAGEKILLEKAEQFDAIIFRSPTIVDEGRLGLLSLLFEFIDDGKKVPLVGNG